MNRATFFALKTCEKNIKNGERKKKRNLHTSLAASRAHSTLKILKETFPLFPYSLDPLPRLLCSPVIFSPPLLVFSQFWQTAIFLYHIISTDYLGHRVTDRPLDVDIMSSILATLCLFGYPNISNHRKDPM